MKKFLWVIIAIILILIVAMGVILWNRGETENTNVSGDLGFEIRKISEEISGDNDVKLLNINYEYIEFTADNEYLKTLNDEIKDRAEENVNNFKNYKSDAENAVGTDMGIQLPYVYDNKSYIFYNDNNIIVIADTWYEEAGGPHPNIGTKYYNYDIAQEKELTLKDLYADKTDEEIANIIMEKVKDAYKDDYEEIESGFEMLPLKDNLNLLGFAVQKDGVLIDLTEFVPYAFGECAVKIEYNK